MNFEYNHRNGQEKSEYSSHTGIPATMLIRLEFHGIGQHHQDSTPGKRRYKGQPMIGRIGKKQIACYRCN